MNKKVKELFDFTRSLENDEKDFVINLFALSTHNLFTILAWKFPEVFMSLVSDGTILSLSELSSCFRDKDYQRFSLLKKDLQESLERAFVEKPPPPK
jgi:hypothetical protein